MTNNNKSFFIKAFTGGRTWNPSTIVECEDMVNHLREKGYDDIINAMMDDDCYTHSGRLIVSKLKSKLKIPQVQLEERLNSMKIIINEG